MVPLQGGTVSSTARLDMGRSWQRVQDMARKLHISVLQGPM